MKITYFDHEYEVMPTIQATCRTHRIVPDDPIIKSLCVDLAKKMLEEGLIETVTEPDETDEDLKFVSVRVKCLKRIKKDRE